MTEEFLKALRGLEFDSLTAKEAVELRALLNDAVAKSDSWFLGLARDFAKPANLDMTGRDAAVLHGSTRDDTVRYEANATPSPQALSPQKRRRGRPVPEVKITLNKRPKPTPLAVGGADAETPGPRAAQIFQDSYISKDGPQPGAALPPDHPRRHLNRESSVTPEVDMSDFHEVEEAVRKGQVGKIFQ